MPATRPSNLPRWATVLGTHSSGAASRMEPNAARMDAGWDYQEEPGSNVQNWLHWQTNNWLDYLDQLRSRPATQVVAASNADNESKEAADFKCDGVSDQTEINSAITAASAAGGGVVQLTEGTFTLSDRIVMASKVWLRGAGQGTVIRAVAGWAAANKQIVHAQALTDIAITDLAIDGQRASQTVDHHGVSIDTTTRCWLERLTIHDINQVSGDADAVFLTGTTVGAIVESCDFYNLDGGAIHTQSGPTNLRVADCRFLLTDAAKGLHFEGSGNGSIVRGCLFLGRGILGSTAIDSLTVSGCVFQVATLVANINLSGATHCNIANNVLRGGSGVGGIVLPNNPASCTVQGNVVEGYGREGISCAQSGVGTADDCLIAGNVLRQNCQDADDTYDEIYLEEVNRFAVLNNLVRRKAAANRMRYAVHITGTGNVCTDVLISGNDLQQGQSAGNNGNAIQVDTGATGTVGLPTTATVQQANRQLA